MGLFARVSDCAGTPPILDMQSLSLPLTPHVTIAPGRLKR
jgi:hypothetical protein